MAYIQHKHRALHFLEEWNFPYCENPGIRGFSPGCCHETLLSFAEKALASQCSLIVPYTSRHFLGLPNLHWLKRKAHQTGRCAECLHPSNKFLGKVPYFLLEVFSLWWNLFIVVKPFHLIIKLTLELTVWPLTYLNLGQGARNFEVHENRGVSPMDVLP